MTRPIALLGLLLLAAGCTVAPPRGDASFLASSRREGNRPLAWTPVTTLTFTPPADLAAWPAPAGEWQLRDGALWATAGDANRAILLLPDRPGPLRLECVVTLYPDPLGRLGDITVLLGATADARCFTSGYAVTTGSYYNHCTTIYRLGRPLARTEWSPLLPGRTCHVAVERDGGHLRYWLDDQILLDAWDAAPLPATPARWLGLRTWATTMRIDHVVLSAPAAP